MSFKLISLCHRCTSSDSYKKDNRIHMYFTSEIMPADEVLEIWEKAKLNEKAMKEAQEKAAQIVKAKEARGRELFAKFIPETAQALIVAEFEVDECDSMTDYFATSTSKTVILGWSKHKRDIFSEMRKFADLIPETTHLKQAPEVNSNGEPKTETNKSWWHPADEHQNKLAAYGRLVEMPVLLAWRPRKLGQWLLVDALSEELVTNGRIRLETAMIHNLMGVIAGDFHIDPEPSIGLNCRGQIIGEKKPNKDGFQAKA